ncbi:spore germination protein [Paenibacillus hexagrammi]|uniref:Spore germination protein n=1 Tax=Paenibacillus hexagrammi TaxID=2908839 RepID=A0ABY3SLV2_9BACL|nr:Ger(x)C family spore germination C-terminal domain-containing protein [Paenibacillus sp. YPD9-1]UJF35033.1 spore germination protein [Paenibacillus sp. YPD9-1]
MGLGAFLYENHYGLWKKIENNWDKGENIFSKSQINVHATVLIRRIGNINQSEKE